MANWGPDGYLSTVVANAKRRVYSLLPSWASISPVTAVYAPQKVKQSGRCTSTVDLWTGDILFAVSEMDEKQFIKDGSLV